MEGRVESTAQRVLLEQLHWWWQQLNHSRFDGRLMPPVWALTETEQRLGGWQSATRTLSLSSRLVTERPWGEVVRVLEHEMAHQYVDEVLRVVDETPHGATFRRVCRERGIDARATGRPESAAGVEPEAVVRARKLLALGASSNPHEAEAALAAASRWMRRHGLEMTDLNEEAYVTTRQVGEIRSRRPRHEKLLAGVVTRHFFVGGLYVPAFDVAHARRGRILELIGTPSQLDIAEHAWHVSLRAAERAWRDHQTARESGERTARARFLEGFVMGLEERLAHVEEEDAVHGLVVRQRPEVGEVMARRYPRRRRGRRVRVATGEAWNAGRQAGRELTLHRGVSARNNTSGLLTRKET